MARPMSEYNRKRNFSITSEPADEKPRGKSKPHALRFVIQKHDARRLHYDFRLEMNGTLKSWAVPKGPSLDPKEKRLAVHVEDHPLSYAKFEGSIPKGQYGGGDVIVWDEGVWQPHGDLDAAYKAGKLKFTLIGEKLAGDWTLVKTRLRGSADKEQWLLIKEKDDIAKPIEEYDIVEMRPESVITGELLPMDKDKDKGEAVKPVASKKKPETEAAAKQKKKPAEKKEPAKQKESAKQTQTAKPKIATANKSKTARVTSNAKAEQLTTIPETFSPELATLVSEPPAGDWLYEIKFDGYRMLTRVLDGKVNFFTRNGNDWTSRLPQQAKAIEALGLQDSWLDGEVVVLNEQGLPNFQALQNAFDAQRSQDIIYYLFDAPYLNGEDLRTLPVEGRRKRLEKLIPKRGQPLLRYSAAFEADHESIVQSACAMSLEGVIGKRVGSTYVSRRSDDWIKLKCRLRQEFVIVGYTEPKGSRSGFGAILLGVHDAVGSPELRYAGRVGTGFNEARLNDMVKKLKAIESSESPLSTPLTSQQRRGVQWVKPTLLCEVEFAEWTGEGILRQASFISLRTDKPAKDIIREQPRNPGAVEKNVQSEKKSTAKTAPANAKTAAKKSTKKESAKPAANAEAPKPQKAPAKNAKPVIAEVPISHPDRIIDPQSAGTKLDLASFYKSVAELIAPHLQDRPVSLLRAPDGINGEQFFQKHSENRAIPHVTQLDKSLDPGHGALMEIENPSALIGCVQMNAIEFHTWGATTADMEHPDRFVLDLDPDPALPWRSVVEASRLTLAALDELKLNAFLKTTGGKGMHIIVPLTPDADWATVKAFSKAVAEFMAKQIPDRFVAKMGPQNRIGKIFIDYLRNSRGASTVCAYSVRARPGLAVSVPITRDELPQITRPDQWNIHNLHERLETLKANPWGNYSGATYRKSQKLSRAMWKKLGLDAP